MSAVTRLARALGRADQPDAVGIFIRRDDAGLFELARRSDRRRAEGGSLGPLDGQIVVIKGNIALNDLPTTAGSLSFIAQAETTDAPLVQRLKAQGAIPMGHANLSEFAFSGLGLNPHFGTPRNGLDPDLVPGGSSSGCASAIALGIADFAIGTDTSGSTRVPAAYQGLFGFRPTMGRYEDSGILPLAPSLDTPGPMARDLDGLIALDDALRDTLPEVGAALTRRIVIPDRASLGRLSKEIAGLLHAAAGRLRESGWAVEIRPFAALDEIRTLFDSFGTLVAAEAPDTLARYTRLSNPAIDPNVRRRLLAALPVKPANARQLMATRKRLQALAKRELEGALLLMPTVPAPPPRMDTVLSSADRFAQENAKALRLAMPLAFLDMPALAMPAGASGPGHSLSLTGPAGSDSSILAYARPLAPLLSQLNTETPA
ncbi:MULTISPECIES: amidase [unclassified Leisingera]|uniref:amidase n=1 Tax=unclassified Leisingera TaxID=2614906 RepID=UPI0002E2B7E0|nr:MULTISPECIES: amidase family protein [unclassified Leisingera]